MKWVNIIETFPIENGEYLCRLTFFNEEPYHEIGYYDDGKFNFAVEHLTDLNSVRIEWLEGFTIPS